MYILSIFYLQIFFHKIIGIKDGDKKIAIIEINTLFILHSLNKKFSN